jgi:hypothetical protein
MKKILIYFFVFNLFLWYNCCETKSNINNNIYFENDLINNFDYLSRKLKNCNNTEDCDSKIGEKCLNFKCDGKK